MNILQKIMDISKYLWDFACSHHFIQFRNQVGEYKNEKMVDFICDSFTSRSGWLWR